MTTKYFSIMHTRNYPVLHRLGHLIAAIILLTHAAAPAQSLNQRLGYPDSVKLLILHADDLGVAHSENQASFESLISGAVNSGSIMMPCPWLPEIIRFQKDAPNMDLGLHLTLTSEWKLYKWGPVASRNTVPGLVDSLGYLYDNCADVVAHAKPEEVERELRAQIEKAKALGIQPSHFDSHMGCLFFTNPTLFEIYLRLGREYKVPAMVSRDLLDQLPEDFRKVVTDKDVVIDHIYTATPQDFAGSMQAYYDRVLRSLQPGVSAVLMHLAYEGPEMRGVSFEHPDWGAAWRQADFEYFASAACRNLLKEQGIHLITWREIANRLKG